MNPLKFGLGTILTTVLLFVWSGVVQNFPWGVPSAQVLYQVSAEPEEERVPNARDVPYHTLTTADFDREMVGRVTTLTTDNTFSWIVTRPIEEYDPVAYLGKEALTQMVVGGMLTVLLWLTTGLGYFRRMGLVALCAIMASTATYGQLLNWWGLPLAYTLGVSLNLVVGWVLVTLVVGRLVFPCSELPLGD